MKKSFLLSALVAAALTVIPQIKAELLIGLTVQNVLIGFDSTTPGTIMSFAPITGVVAGDTLFGIDRRPVAGPNNGVLYGFGVNTTTGTGRIYTLDVGTGVAVPVAVLAADPADTTAPFPFASVNGSAFGVDFNPTVDRLRVVSNTGQNLRINVGNGLTQLDVPLAYAAGDPQFGSIPSVTDVAYSNNFGGATTTTLRGVDSATSPDNLVVFSNPNGGQLTSSLALPFDGSGVSGYDISGLTGTAFFSVTSAAGGPSQLFASGPGGVTFIGFIGGGVSLRGLAALVGAPVTVPENGGTAVSLLVGVLALGLLRWKSLAGTPRQERHS